MSQRAFRLFFALCLTFIVLLLGACAKKVAVANATPPPPPPAAPTASITVSPASVTAGQATQLS